MISFNRTFMELKFQLGECGHSGDKSFNRTFMELKSHHLGSWCSV